MWKISRNIIFTRLSKKQGNYADHLNISPVLSKIHSSPSSNKERFSEQDEKKKHNFKQKERFWNCEKMRFFLLTSMLEKASWLGTVTILCFNIHFKHVQFMLDCENGKSRCGLSRNVLAMPDNLKANENASSSYQNAANRSFPTCDKTKDLKHPDAINSFDIFKQASLQYAAAIHISSGLTYLGSNLKKAFHHFQKAAQLGSSQGFYNLGLCYELGKGTKVNLTRAAFCYKKAAMKGHGLASFNLAVYFFKGLGGLPVDSETAKHLIKQAAEKDVSEAQLYIGLESLENKKYSKAFEMFNMLAEKDILDGKYYLGMCYENGWGVNKNESMAAKLFSQAALSGHSKSILKLSKFYENGLGDCDLDLDFSTALCQLLADSENEELKTSLLRLKVKKSILSNKQILNRNFPFMKVKKAIQNSSSVPELTSYQNEKSKNNSETFKAQSSLSLITPFLAVKSKAEQSKKCSFYVEDDNQESQFAVFHSHLKITMPKMMAAGL